MDSLSKSHVSNEQLSKEIHPLKKRKVLQKTVVTVKVGTKKAGKLKNEGPPPDFWSWRKYGQKPIKGSPYPRGYYRCSSSKGCSAKKQVERSKSDGSMFIITYTSTHNHPGPNISTLNLTHQEEEIQSQPSDQDLPNQEQDHEKKQRKFPYDGDAAAEEEEEEDLHFHFSQSPLNGPKELEITIDEEEVEEELEKPIEKTRECLDEENDFFDELEELPIPPSSFSSLMRSYYFDEIRVPS